MAHVYTPGLRVSENILLKKERRLPLQGDVLVSPGDKVKFDAIVAQTFLPGNVEMINVAGKLGVEPQEVPDCMLKPEGEKISKGEIIAQSKGFLGLFKSEINSPADGVIESISKRTGQVIIREPHIPVQINAYIDGIIDEIIEKEGVVIKTYATFIQGIFGIGGETTGELVLLVSSPDEEISLNKITPELSGKIIVCGFFITNEIIQASLKTGVKGIIAGGIDDQDLRNFLGYDLGVAITGSEEKGITLIITEGFGKIKMADKTFQLLTKNQGKLTSINGATQIRAGVMRPEIIIPYIDKIPYNIEEKKESLGMEIGSMIRIIRTPHFGELAKVISLPSELQKIQSEALVRVVEVELENKERLIIPRANVELIES
ncbi:MAG: hypothetical protein HYU63_07855 [Armatimonadetes bacterium]|nr:hypothetical protein [Armatimonadota bacterium]